MMTICVWISIFFQLVVLGHRDIALFGCDFKVMALKEAGVCA